jgi:hypothetical protein
MKRHSRIIIVYGDDGRTYSLYIYTNYAPTEIGNARSTLIEDIAELATSDGQPVRWKAKGLYEIELSHVLLRSSASDAP